MSYHHGRFLILGMLNDLKEAVSVAKAVPKLQLYDNPWTPSSFQTLFNLASTDLEEAIKFDQALQLRRTGHRDRVVSYITSRVPSMPASSARIRRLPVESHHTKES